MDYTPLIVELNEVIPTVVISELRDETEVLDGLAAESATERTQRAWKREHVHTGHSHAW